MKPEHLFLFEQPGSRDFRSSGWASAACRRSFAYVIAATNVTMPMSGNGSTAYSVSGIPMTGTLICLLPICGHRDRAQASGLQLRSSAGTDCCDCRSDGEGNYRFPPLRTGCSGSVASRYAARPGRDFHLAGVLLLGLGFVEGRGACVRSWCWRWARLVDWRRSPRVAAIRTR